MGCSDRCAQADINLQTEWGTDRVKSISFGADGRVLAGAGLSFGGSVGLWDTVTGEQIGKLAGHNLWVEDVVFRLDGTVLASGGYDGTVLLWKVD